MVQGVQEEEALVVLHLGHHRHVTLLIIFLRVRILFCKAVSLASLLRHLEHEFGNTRIVKYFSLKNGKYRLQNNFK